MLIDTSRPSRDLYRPQSNLSVRIVRVIVLLLYCLSSFKLDIEQDLMRKPLIIKKLKKIYDRFCCFLLFPSILD